jgi:small subunit ribosomal protein S27Ae
MSILKYYKVDSDGKIKRLRRECPTAECGAGIFVSVPEALWSYTLSQQFV